MEPDTIVNDCGIIITCKGHVIAISDTQGNPGHIPVVVFDKCVFVELHVMCRMVVHMVADMPGDRAYTIAVFLSNLFGGYVKDIHVQLSGYMETETR